MGKKAPWEKAIRKQILLTLQAERQERKTLEALLPKHSKEVDVNEAHNSLVIIVQTMQGAGVPAQGRIYLLVGPRPTRNIVGPPSGGPQSCGPPVVGPPYPGVGWRRQQGCNCHKKAKLQALNTNSLTHSLTVFLYSSIHIPVHTYILFC